jgi:steroid delta-isomerase-like uncharacterized protein
MDLIEIARKNSEAWNRRDAEAIVATFAKSGKSSHPRFGENLDPDAIAKSLRAVWTAYPDAVVEIVNVGEIQKSIVVTEWIMRATNTGALPDGTPATGRTVALHGVSLAQFEGDRIVTERVYFDRQNLFEQLGLIGKSAPAKT